MPSLSLNSSPLVPGISPVEIHYLDEGNGPPLVLMHGGWGNSIYPFNRQIESLRDRFRIICPDRSGYGSSNHELKSFPIDFHERAAAETLSLLDSLGIERAYFWGHSDGAVIAAIIGFTSAQRVSGLILEAFHYYRLKLASREFFEALAYRPESLDDQLRGRFAKEFGSAVWTQLITSHAQAWLKIAVDGSRSDNLYDDRLREIRAATLFIHGKLDPRTEPGELAAAMAAVPHAEVALLELGGHSPHSERATSDLTTKIARAFLTRQI